MYPEFRTKNGITRKIDESFKSFIKSIDMSDYFDYVVDHKFYIRNRYNDLNEYYSGNIPEDVINRFKFDPHNDYILENLNAHNTDLFIKKLKETFGFLRIRLDDRYNDDIRAIKVDILYYPKGEDFINSFLASDQFKNFLNFFGYILLETSNKRDYIEVIFEPVNAISADDLVYGKCHGILYHITDSYNKDKILNSGIRLRKSDKGSLRGREYTERNYFLALYPYCKGYKTDPRILKAIDRYCIGNDENASVFRVNVDRTGICFYKDTYAKFDIDSDDSVYSYVSIPKGCITFLGDIKKQKYSDYNL